MPIATTCNRHRTIIPAGERCPKCCAETGARDAARRSANNVRLGRNTAHWRRIAARRIIIAEGLCEIGLEGCTGEATTVDLIGGGDHSRARIEDTRAACRSCHGQVDGGRR
jgi:hypothetical protein